MRLRSVNLDDDLGAAFYEFDIVEADSNATIGRITLLPEKDSAKIPGLGHSGGEMHPEARGKGYYGRALQALMPLAREHGLDNFMITVGRDNDSAKRTLEKLGFQYLGDHEDIARYMIAL